MNNILEDTENRSVIEDIKQSLADGCNNFGFRLKRNLRLIDERKRMLEDNMRSQITDNFKISAEPESYESLSGRNKVYLGAMLCYSYSAEEGKFMPLNSINREFKLAPTESMCKSIISYLLKENVIMVDPDSYLNSFSKDGKEFDYRTVNYLLNVDICNLSLNEFINQKIPEALHDLRRDVVVEECIEYLIYITNQKGLRYVNRNIKKARGFIRAFSYSLSESELIGTIDNAVIKAFAPNIDYMMDDEDYFADLLLNEFRNTVHHKNLLGEGIILGENRKIMQSMISIYLYDIVLKKGASYFYEKAA